MLNRARLWIRSVVLRRRLEREMQEEMAEHIERSTARLVARGLSPEEARMEARREFGNVAYLQEEGRLARGTGWLDALAADLRYALRQFARRPGTTLTMGAVLTLGMSIATLLFSFVHSFAVQPPRGIARADDLVRIRGSQEARGDGRWARGFPEEEFLEYRKLTGDFAAVAGWTDDWAALDAGADVERRGLGAAVTFVTEGYFSVLGVRPALGPGLPVADAAGSAAAPAAVIGHAAWDQLFARSPDVIGRTVAVNGVPVTIVGVAPERFSGVGWSSALQLWMPLPARRVVMPGAPSELRAAARLRPGVSPRQATAAARVVAARAASAEARRAGGGGDRPVRPSTDVVPLLSANGDPDFDQEVRTMSLGLALLGTLVLLVVCTNVSALLTGVAMARRQEIAVRLSLGAARSRIIRQLLTESALLATVAGIAAVGVVALAARAMPLVFPEMPVELVIAGPAMAFTFGVALAVGVLFGLSPALHATRLAIAGALRDSSAGIAAARAGLQRALVVAQTAFTVPLVVFLMAMLLFVSREYRPQGGAERAGRTVMLSVFSPAAAGSPEAKTRTRAAADRLAERLRATPGVESAIVDWGSAPSLGHYVAHGGDAVDGAPREAVELMPERVGEGYFGLMGIPLVRGRDFAPADAASGEPRPAESAVIIGADLARTLWGGADAVGRRLRAADEGWGGPATLAVVGVIDDPAAATRKANGDYRVFLPPDTSRIPEGMLLRTSAAAEPLLPTLRRTAQEEAPGAEVRVRTLAMVEDERREGLGALLGGFLAAGGTALLLSAIGLYAVVAFSVGQRTAEIAVRIAVGARAGQIGRRFLADGLRLSAIGLAIGLPFSLVGLRALVSMGDGGFPPTSIPFVLLMAGLGVVLVATAAAWIPSRRAASVDPALVLRRE